MQYLKGLLTPAFGKMVLGTCAGLIAYNKFGRDLVNKVWS
jgi:glutamine amidotransferase PdxT